MTDRLSFACALLLSVHTGGCSSGNNTAFTPVPLGQTGGASQGAGGSDANAGGSTSGGRPNHLGSGGHSAGGTTSAGGTAEAGGASSKGGMSGGGASSNGGTNAGGAATGGASNTGGSVGTGGFDGGAEQFCGTDPCTPTRCAGIGCGPAVCCHGPNGPVCIHGASECPAPDGGVGVETLTCWSRSASSDFTKSCVADRDCFVAEHWAGCCRVEAVGLNTAEQGAFDAFETQCGGAPPCGCCCDVTTAEDGKTVPAGSTAIVACVAGFCTTKAP
jgi:hypothetical protein